MFSYFVRICALKGLPVISMLLTPRGRQSASVSRVREFEFSLHRTSIDCLPLGIEEMILDENPFGAICASYILARETKDDPDRRYAEKIRILIANHGKKWSRQMESDVFRIINWMMVLPHELERKMWRVFLRAKGRPKMNWMCPIEKIFFEDGVAVGVKRGMKSGIGQGFARGRKEAVAGVLERQLEIRFGPLSKTVLKRLIRASPDKLAKWAEALIDARTLKDVFGK